MKTVERQKEEEYYSSRDWRALIFFLGRHASAQSQSGKMLDSAEDWLQWSCCLPPNNCHTPATPSGNAVVFFILLCCVWLHIFFWKYYHTKEKTTTKKLFFEEEFSLVDEKKKFVIKRVFRECKTKLSVHVIRLCVCVLGPLRKVWFNIFSSSSLFLFLVSFWLA